jgi:hypothetical protein
MDNLEIKQLSAYLAKSPIIDLIETCIFDKRPNGKTKCFIKFTNPSLAVLMLRFSPYFLDAHLGYLHNQYVGSNYDFRSFTKGNFILGSQSLQINIGKESGLATADLDLFNPAQDLESLLGHTLEVLNII